ncbi:MAG: hypothetical protein CMM53_12005 [Rhodospirillaceae bacterium]|nr:hypothetical protein [Rhodospirillaceae bacterium]|tara:strand:+ start:2325 stop:2744 length:420 start_codon:yes stop_codon:yes gene_type:complete
MAKPHTPMKIYLLFLGFFVFIPFSASAHPEDGIQLGMSHLLLSTKHILIFCITGIVVGLLPVLKLKTLTALRIGIIILVFGYQLISHGISDGIIFGFEVTLPGSLITMITWQLTEFLSKYFEIKAHKRKMALVQNKTNK